MPSPVYDVCGCIGSMMPMDCPTCVGHPVRPCTTCNSKGFIFYPCQNCNNGGGSINGPGGGGGPSNGGVRS